MTRKRQKNFHSKMRSLKTRFTEWKEQDLEGAQGASPYLNIFDLLMDMSNIKRDNVLAGIGLDKDEQPPKIEIEEPTMFEACRGTVEMGLGSQSKEERATISQEMYDEFDTRMEQMSVEDLTNPLAKLGAASEKVVADEMAEAMDID